MTPQTILWLAVAEGRGHLMRAHLARQLLAPEGIDVEIATTSEDGRAFLDHLGSPATVLPGAYHLSYDQHQNLALEATQRELLRYLASPARLGRDLRALGRAGRNATLVINDILHPALLAAPVLRPRVIGPVVQVYARHTLRALEELADDRWPAPLASRFHRLLGRLLDGSMATIEYGPGITPTRRLRGFELPPLLAAPSLTRAQVRARLGVAPDRPLAVAYLNPHFRDSAIGVAIEDALRGRGFHFAGVGQGIDRPNWEAAEPDLVDLVAAADVLVAPPGAATLCQVAEFGVPWIALRTDQPEQERNLAQARRILRSPFRSVHVTSSARLAIALDPAVEAVSGGPRPRIDPSSAMDAVRDAWRDALVELVQSAAAGPTRRSA